jgi:hypothetical protein
VGPIPDPLFLNLVMQDIKPEERGNDRRVEKTG